MKELINAINLLMDKILEELDFLDFENFEEQFYSAKLKAERVEFLRIQLKRKYTLEQLAKADKNLFQKAKLIQKKFDDIVEEKKRLIKEVKTELSKIQNKKKLANYGR